MPSLGLAGRWQKAVLWNASGYNDYGELKVTSATGTELRVRWEDKKSIIQDPLRGPIEIDAVVYVGQAIAVGSVMWKGQLNDYTGAEQKWEVVRYEETPDLRGRDPVRLVYLRRLSAELPSA